ncbi:hypothetical protein CapIbe_011707 [Capra ibex]
MFTAGAADINQDAQFWVPCIGVALEKRVSIDSRAGCPLCPVCLAVKSVISCNTQTASNLFVILRRTRLWKLF